MSFSLVYQINKLIRKHLGIKLTVVFHYQVLIVLQGVAYGIFAYKIHKIQFPL